MTAAGVHGCNTAAEAAQGAAAPQQGRPLARGALLSVDGESWNVVGPLRNLCEHLSAASHTWAGGSCRSFNCAPAWSTCTGPSTLQVVAGLALLALSTHTFHKRAAERSDARQQLRVAKEARAAQGGSSTTAGLLLAGRRGGAASTVGTNTLNSGTEGHHGADSGEEEPRQLQEEAELGQALPHRLQGEVAALVTAHEQITVGASAHERAAGVGSASQQAAQQAELQRYCEQHFGLDWLRRWGATARQVCSASRQLSLSKPAGTVEAVGDSGSGLGSGGSGGSSSGAGRAPSAVTCRSVNDTHMPAGSAPHVLCDATNLLLDPSKLVGTPAPRPCRCRWGWAGLEVPGWLGGRMPTSVSVLVEACHVSCTRSLRCRCCPPPRSAARAAPRTAPATCAPPPPTTATTAAPLPWTAPGRGSAWMPSARTTSRQAGGPAGVSACAPWLPGAMAARCWASACLPGLASLLMPAALPAPVLPAACCQLGAPCCQHSHPRHQHFTLHRLPTRRLPAGHIWQLPVPARAGSSRSGAADRASGRRAAAHAVCDARDQRACQRVPHTDGWGRLA